jgi:hypothetical protein
VAAADLDRQVELARQYGYTDDEISAFLDRGGSVGPFVQTPASRQPGMGAGEYSPQERSQLSAGQPIERQVDRGEGAGFFDRLQASFKSTPKERVDFWRARMGQGNVVVTPNEEIIVQDPEAPGKWHPIDPAGADLGDIADLVGDLPEAIGVMLMGPGGILRAGAGALLGNLAKQATGAALPGKVEARPLERAGEAATSAALGAGAQGAANLLRAPGAIKRKMTEKLTEGIQTDVRAEGLRLEKAVGGMLRPSQVTGSANLAKAEGFLERNPFASSTMAKMDLEQRMIPIQRRVESILQRISGGGGAQAEDLGLALKEGLEKAVDVGWDNLSKQAARDFAVLEGAAGKAPAIPLTNFVSGLREIVDLYGQRGYGTPAASVAEQATKMIDEIVGKYGENAVVSPAELQRRLAHLGRAAYGKAPSIFRDVDIPFAREVQRDLHKLLRADLEVAAQGAGQGSIPTLLRQARANYETNLEAVHSIQNNLLARYLGRAPDQIDPASIADFFLKTKPGTLRGTLELLENVSPGTANIARAHVLERALETGRTTAQQSGDFVPGSFDMTAFLKALPSKDKLRALFGGRGQTSESVLKEISDVVDFTERAVMTKQSGTIQRPQHQQVIALMRNFSVGAFAHTFGSLGMARVIASPEGRKVFIGMGEAKTPTAMRRAMMAADRVMPGIIYELMKSLDMSTDPNLGEPPAEGQ